MDVIGWGGTKSGGPISEVLLEVEVSVADNQDCNEYFEDLANVTSLKFITENMICAEVVDGKGTCQVIFFSN